MTGLHAGQSKASLAARLSTAAAGEGIADRACGEADLVGELAVRAVVDDAARDVAGACSTEMEKRE